MVLGLNIYHQYLSDTVYSFKGNGYDANYKCNEFNPAKLLSFVTPSLSTVLKTGFVEVQ